MLDNVSTMSGRYKYKGNYYFIRDQVQMKHPTTREWVEAVTYRPAEGGPIYTREAKDFFKKFKRV